MDSEIKKQLIKILEEGKDIPEEYKNILFPESKRSMSWFMQIRKGKRIFWQRR